MHFLTARFDEKSTYIDPRLLVKMYANGVDEPVMEWDVPHYAASMELVLVEAQKWMLVHVYNKPCATVEEAKTRNLNTQELDYRIRVNKRGMTDAEVSAKAALTRLKSEASKHGYKVTESFTLEKV